MPTTTPAINSSIVTPTSAVPVNLGVATFVIPSPTVPESSAGKREGAGGGDGGELSIRSETAAPRGLEFPATSVAVAATEYVPSDSDESTWIR